MSKAIRPATMPAGGDGSLGRLLETEALLAERLSAAGAECARIREAARIEARAADDEEHVVILATRQSMEREYAERREARLSAIEAEKVRRVEALRALPASELERLAAELVDRLLRQAAGPAP